MTTGCTRSRPNDKDRRFTRLANVIALSLCVPLLGCWSSNWARLRSVPRNPLTQPLDLLSRNGPRPTARTLQLLRRHDLARMLDDSPEQLLAEVQHIADTEPTADNVYAVAELAYIAGKKIQDDGNEPLALDMYGTAVANAYLYLLDEKFDEGRNPYDPRFRRACDLYNTALESTLRMIQRQGLLKPGRRHTIQTARQEFDFTITVRGPWHEENFSELKFASDFEVQGLTNHYRTYGLGVPLIGVYKRFDGCDRGEVYYPPGMSFPITAFLRVLPAQATRTPDSKLRHHCKLELLDTLAASDVRMDGRLVPLETDLTTPLAYCLDNPVFKQANVATRGLLSVNESRAVQGLYMLELYDPNKIPVLMVHGFWSSLITWMEMYNDLRGTPEIRDNFQFWFYLYPTGQPFWVTAAQLREELHRARVTLDAERQAKALDRMVLVGHSMGALICILQTLESGDDYWKLVSEQPFRHLPASTEIREKLARVFFFRPDSSVHKVVMIAAPHRGSNFSNAATRWLGRRLISLPERLVQNRESLLLEYPQLFPSKSLLRINTSIDSFASDSPILPLMLRSPRGSWVRYHNIVGLVDDKGVLGRFASGSDGIVSFPSAHRDDVDSEVVVTSDHMDIHRAPRTILEVHRILREHLQEVRRENVAQDNSQPRRLPLSKARNVRAEGRYF